MYCVIAELGAASPKGQTSCLSTHMKGSPGEWLLDVLPGDLCCWKSCAMQLFASVQENLLDRTSMFGCSGCRVLSG